MPGKKELFFSLREQIDKMIGETKQISKPLIGAAALLLLSAGMTYLVVVSLQEKINPLPPLASQVSSGELPQLTGGTNKEKKNEQPITAEKVETVETIGAAKIPQQHNLTIVLEGQVMKEFGWQPHPLYQDWRFHTGVDIATAPGELVKAVAAGQVSSVATDSQFGLTVTVKSGEYTVEYASLSEAAVTQGTTVTVGSLIGKAGESPGEPYAHVHLAARKQGKFIDPRNMGD